MLCITHPTIPRQEVWTTFRRTHDVRMRERYHWMLLLLDGKTCADIAPWLYRDEDTIRSWSHAVHAAGRQGLERAPIPGRPP